MNGNLMNRLQRRAFLQRLGRWLLAMGMMERGTGFLQANVPNSTIRGPLRVHPQNPRYFTDDGHRAVYLTGSHTWSNFEDLGIMDPPPAFDFEAYLNFLQAHHHNFIRLWRWEPTRWQYVSRGGRLSFSRPHPWARTGPGQAKDGKPKFNLKAWNEDYFRRLRDRVAAAERRGIFVSIMLFEGHCLQFAEKSWQFHPFHPANNINGIDAKHLDYYTLKHPHVLALQEAYVRKVIDTVHDLNNVLYEICNEAGPYSTEWQYHMIRFIREYEQKKGKQHPVGMTFQYRGGSNQTLFQSPADWISPNPQGGYRDHPPVNDGRKVILCDTDHLWGEGGNPQWVWKAFTRGHQPLFMDRIAALNHQTATWCGKKASQDIPHAESIRKAMGLTRRIAESIDLAQAIPQPDQASSGYCLVVPGKTYVVYSPDSKPLRLDLKETKGTFRVRWLHPVTGKSHPGRLIEGGRTVRLTPPFPDQSVLWLQAVKK